jgi:hypothetical protein
MNSDLSKKLSMLLNKIPKKDLEQNLEKAKNILANCNQDDLNKLLNSKQVSNFLGNDKESLSKALKDNKINLDELKNFDSNQIK